MFCNSHFDIDCDQCEMCFQTIIGSMDKMQASSHSIQFAPSIEPIADYYEYQNENVLYLYIFLCMIHRTRRAHAVCYSRVSLKELQR